jgi:hypothetical protein
MSISVVTQRQYRQIMGATPSKTTRDDLPAVSISDLAQHGERIRRNAGRFPQAGVPAR